MALSAPSWLRLARNTALAAAAFLILVGADSCKSWFSDISLDELRRLLQTPAWGGIDADENPGVRVHFYPSLPRLFLQGDVLPEGAVVEPYTPVGPPGETRICRSSRGCLLIYVDTDPWAHYAHRVVIALWRLDTLEFQEPIVADWWPMVDGVPVLNTVGARERTDFTWLGKPIPIANPGQAWGRADWAAVLQPSTPSTPTPWPGGPLPTPTPTPTPCPVWAVVAVGYDDPDDTFDEDGEGMYAVLTGHGVPEEQIYYLSPDHGTPPCPAPTFVSKCPTPTADSVCPTPAASSSCLPTAQSYRQSTSFCNLKNVFEQILPARLAAADAAGAPCEEMLFFVSTHGSVVKGKGYLKFGETQICASDLAGWLAGIDCDTLTIVIEACRSGSFIDDLSVSPPGTFQQTRRIFTSTSKSGVSHMDVDWEASAPNWCVPGSTWKGDPNPGDSGSETVWGYIEAYGTSIADLSPNDDQVSFGEAVTYAIQNDVMALNSCNNPKTSPSPPPALIAHSCCPAVGQPNVGVDFAQPSAAAAGGPVQMTANETTTLHLTVTNTATGPGAAKIAVATVKVYWAAGGNPDWSSSFYDHQASQYFDHQIGDTLLLTDLAPGASTTLQLEWEVDQSLAAGDQLTLVLTVDSPQDPIPQVWSPIQASSFLQSTNNAAGMKINVIAPPNPGPCPVGCASMP